MTGTSLVTIRRGSPVLPIFARTIAAFFPTVKEAYDTLDTLECGVVEVVEFDNDLTLQKVYGPPPFIDSGVMFQLTPEDFIKVRLLFQGVSITILIERSRLLVHIYEVGK